MVGHGGSSAGSYLADPTSPIPSHCAPIAATSAVRVNFGCVFTGGESSHPVLEDFMQKHKELRENWAGKDICV